MTMTKEINDENIKEVIDNYFEKLDKAKIQFVKENTDEGIFGEKIGKFKYRNVIFEVNYNILFTRIDNGIEYSRRTVYCVINERSHDEFKEITKYNYINYPHTEVESYFLESEINEIIKKVIYKMKDSIDNFFYELKNDVDNKKNEINRIEKMLKPYF